MTESVNESQIKEQDDEEGEGQLYEAQFRGRFLKGMCFYACPSAKRKKE